MDHCGVLNVPVSANLAQMRNFLHSDNEFPTSICISFSEENPRKRKCDSVDSTPSPESSTPPELMLGNIVKAPEMESSQSPRPVKKLTLIKSSSFSNTLKRISSSETSDKEDDSLSEMCLNEAKEIIENAARKRIKCLVMELDDLRAQQKRLAADSSISAATVRVAETACARADREVSAGNKALDMYLCSFCAVTSEESAITSGNPNIETLDAARRALQQAETELSHVLKISFDGVTTTGKVSPLIRSTSSDRSLGEWVVSELDSMPNSKLTKTCLERILASENFAMLTGENPFALTVDDIANKAFNNQAKSWLAEQGLIYHETVGRYDHGERSFLVEGMTRFQAALFARKFGQESVAHKDGLVMDCGSCILFDGNGPTFLDAVNEESNHFSALKDKNGQIIAFNFTPTEKYLEPEQPYDTLLE